MTRPRHAVALAVAGAALLVVGIVAPEVREAAVVAGIFFLLLAVGVTVWDPRGGH